MSKKKKINSGTKFPPRLQCVKFYSINTHGNGCIPQKRVKGWRERAASVCRSGLHVSWIHSISLHVYTSGLEAYKVIICFGTLHLSAPNNKMSAYAP